MTSSSTKRIYLDVCALCRPFDDQTQMRIRLETDAVQLILSHIRAGNLTLIVSPAHMIEIGAIEDLTEREHLFSILRQVGNPVTFELKQTRIRAERLTMKDHTFLREDEMVQRAIDVLMNALGPVETIRFLTLPRRRRLDSVTRHRQWQDSLDKDRFFDQVFGAEEAFTPPAS